MVGPGNSYSISVGLAANKLTATIQSTATMVNVRSLNRIADLVDIRDRVLVRLNGADESATIPGGSIVAGDDISPSAFVAADWRCGGAIVLAAGSASSHVAMLARARGTPMVVGLGPLSWEERPPALALVDGMPAPSSLTLSRRRDACSSSA
jgi:phosphotransferase system enzyme I (PtsI)